MHLSYSQLVEPVPCKYT